MSGTAVWLMTGRAVGEYLEMKAPQAAQVLFLPFRIEPHDWQISISNFVNSKKIVLSYSKALAAPEQLFGCLCLVKRI